MADPLLTDGELKALIKPFASATDDAGTVVSHSLRDVIAASIALREEARKGTSVNPHAVLRSLRSVAVPCTPGGG